jgi:hypothetical protein
LPAREDQQQARGVADPRRVEPGRPVAARRRREARLRRRARELAAQLALEPRHDIREGHGTIVIAEQLLCGAG